MVTDVKYDTKSFRQFPFKQYFTVPNKLSMQNIIVK